MKAYTSAEPITLTPGESKAVKFVGDDGTEHYFIVSIPVGPSRLWGRVVSITTNDGVVSEKVAGWS